MKIYNSITELTGKTPLLRLHNYEKKRGIDAVLLAKLEYLNHAGSVKDRTALAMLTDAEERGLIGPGSVIIEPTSGNTGIGLASAAAARGYRVILTMSDTMSVERRRLLAAYGAEVVLTDGSKGMQGAIDRAAELCREIPGGFIPGQFVNPANPEIHYRTTGPEIWEDTGGKLDIFIAGVGTGGTLTGTARYLKEKKPDIRIVALEPSGSPVLSGGKPGHHALQGIGGGFVPDTLDTSVYDEVFRAADAPSLAAGREIARCEGVLVGITSGAVLHAAESLAKRPENRGKTMVLLFPDSGERYMSTEMYN